MPNEDHLNRNRPLVPSEIKIGESSVDRVGYRLLKERIITEKQLESALQRQKQHGGRLGENLIALGYLTDEQIELAFKRHPPIPQTPEETGLDVSIIAELILKHTLFMGEFTMSDMADQVKLSYAVIEKALELLRRDKYVEVKGGTGYAATTYTFKATETGKNYGTELMELCRYVGPAPVNLGDYQAMVERQTVKSVIIPGEEIRKAFSHLIIKEDVLKKLGPVMSSGKAIFIYGPPGNGKTTIAETLGALLPGNIYVPYALTVGGQIITVYDPVTHVPAAPDSETPQYDRRWVRIKRPFVITGGELVMRMLDLDFDPISKYYEASLQIKANNGILVIDDFGRQHIEPQQLLNRWIVPLDRAIDFMTLHTGMKFSIPFNMLVLFATNIEPSKLVDEAFLRRIQYKIKIDHPTEDDYKAIFKKVCASNEIEFDEEMYRYLINSFYKKLGISFNACHPRDIIDYIVVNARYYHQKPELTKENIDAAWTSYFVES